MAQPHDLYFFVGLPSHAASRAFGFLQGLGLASCTRRGAQMREEGLHITVEKLGRFGGGVPNEQIQLAMAAAAGLTAEPFDIQLDLLQSVTGPDGKTMAQLTGQAPGLRGIRGFERSLAQAMRQAGFDERQIRRSFSPHVTLDYRHAPFARRSIAPLGWRVSEFMLVDSLYGLSQHDVLGCWPLAPRQQTFPW